MQVKLRGSKDTCHETINHLVAWLDNKNGRQKQRHLADHILARLFSLFINILCIFAQDCGGLDRVIKILAAWTVISSALGLPSAVRPRLLVVTSIFGDTFDSEALRFRLRVLSNPKFSELFSSLNIINILGICRIPSRKHFNGLAEVLYYETHLIRAKRVNAYTLFSIIHIAAFLMQHYISLLPYYYRPLILFDAREKNVQFSLAFSTT